MSRPKVLARDKGAKCHDEPYYPEIGPTGGLRYYVVLSNGRRLPWGNTAAHAWRLAEKNLASELPPVSASQAQRNLERDLHRLESNTNA